MIPKQFKELSLKKGSIGWIIFLTGILFYCFAYLLRVYPSIMEFQLLQHFHITAGTFGVLISFYYFAYAPMQLPVGVSVDKIGPRRSLLMASAITLVGVALFAHTQLYLIALLGRFLVGLGAAFAYVTALKLASIWLPRSYFATAVGSVTGLGMIAAIFTDVYLTYVVQKTSFYHALYFPLLLGIGLFIAIFALVQDKPTEENHSEIDHPEELPEGSPLLSYRTLFHYLLMITKNRQMWIIGITGALLYLPSSVFLDLWAIPYLEYARHFSAESAAVGVSVMFAGWVCSSFVTGAVSDLLGTRKMPLVIASFGAAVVSAFIIYVPNIPENALYILLFIFGSFCGPHPLCFTLSKENQSQKIAGTAIAFTNFVIMMGGFVFQPIVGKVLDLVWNGSIKQGIRIYTTSNYLIALSLIPIGLLMAGLLSLFIKETYHDKKKLQKKTM